MSIASELNNLSTNISNAYDTVETKGGTIPTNKNMVNLPTAIESISAGGSFVGIPKGVNAGGIFGSVIEETEFVLPEDATDIAQYTFYYAFYNSVGIKKLDMHSLQEITTPYALSRCCQGATNLESIDFSSLERISTGGQYAMQYGFGSCPKLTQVTFPNLTEVRGAYGLNNAFSMCTNLTKLEFPNLTTLTANQCMGYICAKCNKLTSVNFDSLETVSGTFAFSTAFQNCTSLRELRFPSLANVGSATNQFNNMLSGVTWCTVHFPASMQATIGSWASVTSGFSGINTTVLFDL